MPSSEYRIVQLANGTHSIHSVVERETFHPVVGPVAEAEALYVRQLRLRERLTEHVGEFVIWDVGLGAAANALTVLRATRDLPCHIRLISFDHTLEPLKFALSHAAELGYFDNYHGRVDELIHNSRADFTDDRQCVSWDFHLGDFPTVLASSLSGRRFPAPHAILFDAFSPAKNPAMWTLDLFSKLHRVLDPVRPCAMPTYSRATMLRVSLLLAGFFVGAGHATGEKEETTIAANTLELLDEPLGAAWLRRVRNSTSAEPLSEPVYRQSPLSEINWEKLLQHPQFMAR
ncbi:MAG: hypothetical protein H7X97_12830 [Opitutaceae bacterium]|nr:hypothetical protein [Verrucomicrobiales bacterium]